MAEPPHPPPISSAAAAAAATTTAPGHSNSLDSSSRTDFHSGSHPPLPSSRLRLMCSYGGHIVPRPRDKSLCYVGGDTRIVAVDRRTTTLSSLTSHLSLLYNRPFTLKYQLPHEDLDSLISVTTDEDLLNMIDEFDRLSTSPYPSRLRLFLFPAKPDSFVSVLRDPKSETWFSDALKSAEVIPKAYSADSGSAPDNVVHSESSSGLEGLHGVDLNSVPESMVLETSSSFGSTSSSVSMSSLPPIRVHVEDGGVGLQDKKVKLPSSDSIESDNSLASAISPPQMGIYEDPVVHVASIDNRVVSNPLESESNVSDPSYGIQMQKTVQVSGYQLSPQLDHQQQPQELQFAHSGAHYIPHYPTGPLPVPSYYPMYHPQLHQQQQSYYQPNQPYPIYLLPVRQAQPYNLSMQCNLNDTVSIASSLPPMHPNSAMIPPQVAYKDMARAPRSPPIPELAANVYRTDPAPTPLVHVPSNDNQPQFVGLPQMHHLSQSNAIASMATANYSSEFDDDPVRTQIYKSQPPAPAFSPQYQTMTKAATVLLSEASTQLHTDNMKQQIRASLPQ